MRLALFLFLAWPQVADASTSDFEICGRPRDPSNPLAWEVLKDKYSQGLSERKFTPILEMLLGEFKKSPKQTDSAVKSVFESHASDVIQSRVPCCPDFKLAMQPAQGDFDEDKPVMFGGKIDLSSCEGDRVDQNDELRYYAHAFENIGIIESAPQRMKTARAIRDIEKDFDQLLFHGFPMLPWESLANSWLMTDDRTAKGPPNNLLVLAHPSIGASAPTERFSKVKLDWGMAVEPLGWIHYPRAGKHQRWWGASSLLFLRKGEGLGAGFLLRYSHFSAGLTWHDSNDNNRLFDHKPHVFVGLDFYQFAGKKFRKYSEFTDRIKGDIKEIRAGEEDPLPL